MRRARAGERLTTLDDVDRALDPGDLLITDHGGERAVAIAGVMGGAETEVGATTRDVLIEAAHFEPVTIARSARRHKLPSEASRRFERGVDPALAAAAAQLAVDLLVEHGGGVADPDVTDVGTPAEPAPVTMHVDFPSKIVGIVYLESEVVSILQAIGCTVTRDGDVLTVTPPTWRPDLTTAEDLVEEVARIDGYDRIPSIIPTPPGRRRPHPRPAGAARSSPTCWPGRACPRCGARRSSAPTATPRSASTSTPRWRAPCGWPTRCPTSSR